MSAVRERTTIQDNKNDQDQEDATGMAWRASRANRGTPATLKYNGSAIEEDGNGNGGGKGHQRVDGAPRVRRGPPADGYDGMAVVQRGRVYIMNGAWRLAGITQRRAIDESEGRLSVEEPQLPAPCSVYVPGYYNIHIQSANNHCNCLDAYL